MRSILKIKINKLNTIKKKKKLIRCVKVWIEKKVGRNVEEI